MPDLIIAYTVKMRLPVADPTTILSVADEIKDELTSAFGDQVLEVTPWAQPSIGLESQHPQPGSFGPAPGGGFAPSGF